jgi:signal transduction histidine kinase
MRDVARVLFEQGLEKFGAKAVGIMWRMRPHELRLVFGHGVSELEFRMLDEAARAGQELPVRDAIRGRRSVWLETPEEIRLRYPVLEALRERRGESGCAVVPLVVGEHCPGVIGFTFDRPQPLAEAERTFIEALAQVSAQAFERARLFEAEQDARRDAERFGQLQQHMMAIVGHDLRTPLGAIRLSTDLLSRPGLPADQQVAVIARIRASASRMNAIIGDLLDFGRTRQGLGVALRIERVDLAEVARRAVAELEGTKPPGRISLTAHGDTALSCDGERLLRVLSNLVGNALQHGGQEQVRVEVVGDASEVRLTVHNEGPPIPPALLPHVFEPFRQGENGGGGRVGSTGLGLFIVREIVAAHGGAAAVTSDATSGTTFTVRLPRPPG